MQNRNPAQNIPYPLVCTGGAPSHVLMPYADYLALTASGQAPQASAVPSAVTEKVQDNVNPIRAWREHLSLTQEELGRRMDVSRAAVAQMEQSAKPHKKTLLKAAAAFNLRPAQLLELYAEESATSP